MSIKATVKANENLSFEVSADTEPELFRQVARVHEGFAVKKCGKCGCEDVKFVVRAASKKSKWMEVVCQDFNCRAKLVYSSTEDQTMVYPKTRWTHLSDAQKEERKDEQEYADSHAGFLPNGGFYIWKKKG